MSPPKTPIPLIALGKHRDIALSNEKALAPNFVYAAIMLAYNKDVLLTLLETLNPPPRGIVTGGAFGPEVVQEIQQIAAEWDGKGKLEVVVVPTGTFEREGPAGIVDFQKRELGRVFGVAWETQGGVRRWSDHDPLD
jgi:hypothetical protein